MIWFICKQCAKLSFFLRRRRASQYNPMQWPLYLLIFGTKWQNKCFHLDLDHRPKTPYRSGILNQDLAYLRNPSPHKAHKCNVSPRYLQCVTYQFLTCGNSRDNVIYAPRSPLIDKVAEKSVYGLGSLSSRLWGPPQLGFTDGRCLICNPHPYDLSTKRVADQRAV